MAIVLQMKKSDELLTGRAFKGVDFSGKNLSKCDLRYSKFQWCNFDNADLSEANCEGSDFSGSTFRNSNCYRTNFKDCNLKGVVFEPRDAYGVTFSFSCQTFENMQLGQLWWFCWLQMLAKTVPTKGPVKDDIRAKLINVIGAGRYVKLDQLFKREF
jgi:Pentapeptide repeats (8 copies)